MPHSGGSIKKRTTFISKNGIQFGASGRASVGRVGENGRVRGDWRDRGVERHVRRYVAHRISLGGISFHGERSGSDRSLGLLLSLVSFY